MVSMTSSTALRFQCDTRAVPAFRPRLFLPDIESVLAKRHLSSALVDYGIDLLQTNHCLVCGKDDMSPADCLSGGYTCASHPLAMAARVGRRGVYACCGFESGTPGCTRTLHRFDAPLLRTVASHETGLELLPLPLEFVTVGIVDSSRMEEQRGTPFTVIRSHAQLRETFGIRFVPSANARRNGSSDDYTWSFTGAAVYEAGAVPSTGYVAPAERADPNHRALIAYQLGGPLLSMTEDDYAQVHQDACLPVPFVLIVTSLSTPHV